MIGWNTVLITKQMTMWAGDDERIICYEWS